MDNIKGIIQQAYEQYGKTVTDRDVEVIVKDDALSIRLNTEVPYVGNNFFKLVDTIHKGMEKMGYTYKKTGYFFDFCYLTYTKK